MPPMASEVLHLSKDKRFHYDAYYLTYILRVWSFNRLNFFTLFCCITTTVVHLQQWIRTKTNGSPSDI